MSLDLKTPSLSVHTFLHIYTYTHTLELRKFFSVTGVYTVIDTNKLNVTQIYLSLFSSQDSRIISINIWGALQAVETWIQQPWTGRAAIKPKPLE